MLIVIQFINSVYCSINNYYQHQIAVAKNIIDMDKVEILEEHLEKNVDPDEIHDVRDIYLLSNMFLCNLLDHVYIDFDYLKHKLEFDDDELRCSSESKIENTY